MNLYSIDIRICATAYIKAESEDEAYAKLKATLDGTGIELPVNESGDVAISGRMYDDPELPEVSISPAVSFYGAWDGQGFDLIEEDI